MPGSGGGATATYYEILGVARSASHDEVKRAYLGKSLRWQRRDGDGARVAAETAAYRRREVDEAWATLRNPAARAAYDRMLRAEERAASPADVPTVAGAALAGEPDGEPGGEPGGGPVAGRWAWALVAAALLVVSLVGRAPERDDVDLRTGAGYAPGACVRVAEADRLLQVPCTSEHDAVVEDRDLQSRPCPTGTRPVGLPGGRERVCLLRGS